MGDIISINNIPFFISIASSLSCIILNFYELKQTSNLDYSLDALDFFKQGLEISNEQITRYVYKKNLNNGYVNYEVFKNKVIIGQKNLDYIKLQVIKTLEEKVWVRNNFRYYNTNYVNNLNNDYFNKLKYIFTDYTYNNFLFKQNNFTFNNEGKINIRLLFNNNSPYFYKYSNLKAIFSYDRRINLI